jgi:hypothetical protein
VDEQDCYVCGHYWDVFDGDECGVESLVSWETLDGGCDANGVIAC